MIQKETLQDLKPYDVTATLKYYFDDGKPVEPIIVTRPETHEKSSELKEVTIHDIRGREEEFSLDNTGFQIVEHESKIDEYIAEEKVGEGYYPEIEQILKDVTGASRVFIFGHAMRRSQEAQQTEAISSKPVFAVHVDQSDKAARDRVSFHLPEEAERLYKTRFQILNIWRPIKPILRDPFAVLDASTLAEDDVVTVPFISPEKAGETLGVKSNDAHRWYYMHKQQPSEVLIFKIFDSKIDSRARRVPHSAFDNPEYADESPRESIEVRALVFFENEPAEE